MTQLREEKSSAQFVNSAAHLSSQTQLFSSVRELRHCLARAWARARVSGGAGATLQLPALYYCVGKPLNSFSK